MRYSPVHALCCSYAPSRSGRRVPVFLHLVWMDSARLPYRSVAPAGALTSVLRAVLSNALFCVAVHVHGCTSQLSVCTTPRRLCTGEVKLQQRQQTSSLCSPTTNTSVLLPDTLIWPACVPLFQNRKTDVRCGYLGRAGSCGPNRNRKCKKQFRRPSGSESDVAAPNISTEWF